MQINLVRIASGHYAYTHGETRYVLTKEPKKFNARWRLSVNGTMQQETYKTKTLATQAIEDMVRADENRTAYSIQIVLTGPSKGEMVEQLAKALDAVIQEDSETPPSS